MNRITQVAGAVIGGAALLGIGVAVGSRVAPEPEQVVVAANSDSPLNQQDQFLMQAFTAASRDFDALLAKAKKGNRAVGPAMTKQAVLVLAVKRSAGSTELREAADATAQAMLLLGAGITANNGGAVEDGVAAYQVAQEKVAALGRTLSGEDPAQPQQPPPSEPVPSESAPASSAPAAPAPSGSPSP